MQIHAHTWAASAVHYNYLSFMFKFDKTLIPSLAFSFSYLIKKYHWQDSVYLSWHCRQLPYWIIELSCWFHVVTKWQMCMFRMKEKDQWISWTSRSEQLMRVSSRIQVLGCLTKDMANNPSAWVTFDSNLQIELIKVDFQDSDVWNAGNSCMIRRQ
jgi:hypothetical protein